MAGPELLTVPMPSMASATDVYSGVARMAGVLWCTRHRATGGSDTVVVFCHPSSNFMGHYALAAVAAAGVDAVGMTTRHVGNDSMVLLENCVADIGAVVGHLRAEGYRRVVLVGNSGGGGLASLYQSQAEAPTITASPGGGGPDLTAADLPPVDALVMLMAHPGRAQLLTEWLDPAIRDENEPLDRDPGLDMFMDSNGPPYAPGFVAEYRAAQVARNERITASVQLRLAELAEATAGRVVDLPMRVHGTCADPRFLDLTLDPSDRVAGTLWGDPYAVNLQPATLGHLTTLRSWMSQWSIRHTNGDGPTCLGTVSVPVHVIYGTADQACFPSHARLLYDAVSHEWREITAVAGGLHYLVGQPEETSWMVRVLIDWIRDVT